MTADRAAYVVRRHVLERVAAALGPSAVSPLLVKGAGLAETVYREPWRRAMSDIDVVVRPEALATTLAALEAAGIEVLPVPEDRRRSFALFAERIALVRTGPLCSTLELHTQLDKVVPHPIDWTGVWARAGRVSSLPAPFLVPCKEDHALLVVLHLALSDFDHPPAWEDLAALFRAGLDERAVVERARAWGLVVPLALALARFAELHPELESASLRAELRVAPWRHKLARQLFVQRGPRVLGLRWLARQSLLRDDPLRWFGGIVRFARLRGADRFAW